MYELNLLSCCSEYLAIFKKTVAMHEVFLQRLAAHPSLREDHTFKVFLEFADEVHTYIYAHMRAFTSSERFELVCVAECKAEEHKRKAWFNV